MNSKKYVTGIEHPRMLFLLCFFAFIVGLIIGERENIIEIIIFGISLVLLSIYVYKVRLLVLVNILVLYGVWVFLIQTENTAAYKRLEKIQEITNEFSSKVHIQWTITDKLYTTDMRKSFRLRIDKIDTFDNNNTTFHNPYHDEIGILITIPKNLTLYPGDTVRFTTKLDQVYTSNNHNDIEWYFWLHKIYAKTNLYSFQAERWTGVYHRLQNTFIIPYKEFIKDQIYNNFPRSVAALILGITIGNTDLMESDTATIFKNSWLTHILVVSGSNIAFVILIIHFFLKYFPISRYLSYFIIWGFLFFYGSIVWWEIPVIRATIMGIIAYIAMRSTGKIQSIPLLIGIWWIVLLSSPFSLTHDASFGLSFWATLWILLYNESIEKFLRNYISLDIIIPFISVTLSASIGSFPVLLFYFHTINIISIGANILIAGVMGILLIFSTIYIGLISVASSTILYYFWYILYFLCKYILIIAQLFGNFSPIPIGDPYKILIVITWLFIVYMDLYRKELQKIIFKKNHYYSNQHLK